MLSKKQDTYVESAKRLALESKFYFRIGCVAVSNGKIIAGGFNHERSTLKGKTLTSFHAEIDTLSKILRGRRHTNRKDRYQERRDR